MNWQVKYIRVSRIKRSTHKNKNHLKKQISELVTGKGYINFLFFRSLTGGLMQLISLVGMESSNQIAPLFRKLASEGL